MSPQKIRGLRTPLAVLTCVAAAVLLSPVLAAAWNPTGHRTVAAVAWDHMTPHARARAVELLMHGPAAAHLAALRPTTGTDAERDRALFLNAATWPDMIRDRDNPAHAYHRPTWHYADFYWKFVDGKPYDIPGTGPDSINAGERIVLFRSQMTDPAVPDTTKSVDLVWLIHLVGDIHQPLHTSSLVDPEDTLPRGDLGGNRFRLADQHNLHGYWDDILDIGIARGADEDSIAYATRLAGIVQQADPLAALAGPAAATNVAGWERDGLQVVQSVVYTDVTRGQEPSPAYRARALRVAERQVALAGYRLAALLNEALK
jgi:hypothetical protein